MPFSPPQPSRSTIVYGQVQLVADCGARAPRSPRCRRPGSRRCWAPRGGRPGSAGRGRRSRPCARARPAGSGSPSRPGCTHGKWPKSVKFSSWREASAAHVYGPGGDDRPAVVGQLGHVGQRPARLLERDPDQAVAARLHRNAPIRAFAGTRVGSASCGMSRARCRRPRSASRGTGRRSRRRRSSPARAPCRGGCRGRETAWAVPPESRQSASGSPSSIGRDRLVARASARTRPGASRRAGP